MSKADVHAAWAPEAGPWSRWVKPVLFAHMTDEDAREALDASSLPAWPASIIAAALRDLPAARATAQHPFRHGQRMMDTAIVVDLPSADGVLVGLALACEGFRPVPLYNAIPDRAGVVDLSRVVACLAAGASLLRDMPIDAPPVFLLDAARAGDGSEPAPDSWDNRSMSLPTDFPSAALMRGAGIDRVVLVQRGREPESDLAVTLAAWQAGGLAFLLARESDTTLAPIRIARPSLFRRVMQGIRRALLRGRPDGSYGGVVPKPSSG